MSHMAHFSHSNHFSNEPRGNAGWDCIRGRFAVLKRQLLRHLRRRMRNAFLAVLAPLSVVVAISASSVAVGPTHPAGAAMPSCIVTPTDFANAFLAALGMPDTSQNVIATVAWEHKEGGNWENTAHFNPMNTTYKLTTSVPYTSTWRKYNSTAVQSYSTWNVGLEATVLTITNGYYSNILAALRAGTSAVGVSQAVGNSPWGTGTFTAFLGEVYDPSPPPWESTGCETFDTSGDGWAAVSSTNTTDFCREVGGGPNWVDSKLACTPFTGSTYDTTHTSTNVDWGYARDRAWVEVNGDADYCRLVGAINHISSYLECTPFNGTSFGPSVTSGVVDWGYTTGSAWVETSSGADYCRLVGVTNHVSSYLECTTFNGTSFGPSVTSGVVDWGYSRNRAWVEVNGQPDYCRLVGVTNHVSSYVECAPFTGSGFETTAISTVVDWGYATGAQWVPTSLGADYCRRVGLSNWHTSLLQCTDFNGANFGPTVTSGVTDWGYSTEWAWVPQGSGVDYCRRGGTGPNLVKSYLECTPFTSTSAGATAITPTVVDWGFPEAQGRWFQGPSGAVDYCRWSATTPRDMRCTPFNGASFESTKTSLNLIWGYFTGPTQ